MPVVEELDTEETRGHIRRLFEHFDKDGDGRVTLIEYIELSKRICTLLGGVWDSEMAQGLEHDFAESDVSGTGAIDFEGLCADTLSDFKSMGMEQEKMIEIIDAVPFRWTGGQPGQVVSGLDYQDAGGSEVGEAHQIEPPAAEEET